MKYFIDKEDTNKEPKAIDLGFLHYMAAGMSISDIHRMPKEDLIKVGNEYLEKEKSAIKAFEKLLKKYSHMKENIKPEDRVSLSDLLESGCSVCGNGPCTNESGCNSKREGTNLEEGPYSEAYLLGLEDSIKTLVNFLKDQQNNPDTLKHKRVIDQLPELIDTLEDISFSAGYDRAMKEDKEDYDADQAQIEDEEDYERGYDDDGLPLGEDYNQAGEGEPKYLMDLAPGEEFTFNGKTYTFIKMAGGDEFTAHVEDSTGFELVVSFGGGRVNTGEVAGTSMADMGQGKGHHIDEEEEEDRDEDLIAKLTPVRQYLDEEEGVEPGSDKWKMILRTLTPGSKEYFNWLDMLTKDKATDKPYSRKGVKEDTNELFGKKKAKKELDPFKDSPKSADDLPPGYSMGNTTFDIIDDEDEEEEGEVEQPENHNINGFAIPFKDMETLGKAYNLIVKRFRSKYDKGVFDLRSTKTSQDELDRFPSMKDYPHQLHIATNNMNEFHFREMIADLFREYGIPFPHTSGGADGRLFKGNSLGNLHKLEEDTLNEAPNFDIIDKCLAVYRKWARNQPADSDEVYDTTQAFIKTLEQLL